MILKETKSEHLSKSLRAGIGRFRDPFWSLTFVTFWQEVSKNVIAQKSPYQGIDSSSNQCSWSDVRGTWQGSWEISRENTDEVRRFAPLPRTVYLVSEVLEYNWSVAHRPPPSRRWRFRICRNSCLFSWALREGCALGLSRSRSRQRGGALRMVGL